MRCDYRPEDQGIKESSVPWMAHAPLVHAFDEASAIHDSSRCKHFLRPVALEMTGLVSDPPDPFPTTDACMQPRCAASSSMVYTRRLPHMLDEATFLHMGGESIYRRGVDLDARVARSAELSAGYGCAEPDDVSAFPAQLAGKTRGRSWRAWQARTALLGGALLLEVPRGSRHRLQRDPARQPAPPDRPTTR